MTKEYALDTLEILKTDRDRLQHQVDKQAIAAHAAGASWAQIGAKLGITKQRAHQLYGKESTSPEKTSKIVDADVAGDSVTPSIFLDPIAPAKAPAKPKTARKTASVKEQFPDNKELWPWVHSLTADWDKHEQDPSYPAQPGTGKGPQVCPSCGQNNHHGPQRFTIKFLAECTPTRYDTPANVQAMTEWKASK